MYLLGTVSNQAAVRSVRKHLCGYIRPPHNVCNARMAFVEGFHFVRRNVDTQNHTSLHTKVLFPQSPIAHAS